MVKVWGAKISSWEAEMTYEPSDGQQDMVLNLHSVNVVPNRRSLAYNHIRGFRTNESMIPRDMDECFCLMVAPPGTEDFVIARQLQAVDQQGHSMGLLCEAGTKFRLQVPVLYRQRDDPYTSGDYEPMIVHLLGTERSKSDLGAAPRS
jgi:hypothetical protein